MGKKQVKTLDSLTGLRFLAAFAVFVHHVTGKFGLERFNWPMGAQAVSFFFVLSGFILTYVYHDRLKLSGVKKFYFTRWARIWPLHFVCFAAAIVAFYWPLITRHPDLWKQAAAVFCLVQSWVPDKSWVFAINGVSWSISTEMFFYFMFPLFLIGGQRKFWIKYASLLCTVAGLGAIITWAYHAGYFPGMDYGKIGHTNPLFRLPEFCTGMAIGYVYLNRAKAKASVEVVRKRNIWIDSVLELMSFGAIIGYMLLMQHFKLVSVVSNASWGGPFLSSWCLFVIGCPVFAAVIYLFSKSQGIFGKLFSTKLMVFLGEISFALYMVHQIVIRIVFQYSKVYVDIPPVATGLCILSISLALSIVLFKLIEMPCKSALLKMYDGQFKAGIKAFVEPSMEFARSGLVAAVLLMVLVPMFTLADHKPTVNSDGLISEIVADSDSNLKNIAFGNEMRLLGHNVLVKKGGWELKLVWQKMGETKRARYIHICDAQGKVVANGPREEKLFQRAKVGETFVDSVFVLNRFLEKGNSLGIGFHGVGIGMSKIEKGPRSMKNRRLDLISPADYSELASARSTKSEERLSRSNSDQDTSTRR